MAERAKYTPLIYEKFRGLKRQHPDLLKQIEQRQKFYLDTIYTLMTKNRFLEEQLIRTTRQCKVLEQQLTIKERLGANLPQLEREQHHREETLRKYLSEQKIPTRIGSQAIFEVGSVRRDINTQSTMRPDSSKRLADNQMSNYPGKQVIEMNRRDLSLRRNLYLEDKPVMGLNENPEQLQRQSRQAQPRSSKQFKQQIIKNLNPQHIKKAHFQQDSELDRKSISRQSSNNSGSEAKLSYQRYLSSNIPAVETTTSHHNIHPNYNIKRR